VTPAESSLETSPFAKASGDPRDERFGEKAAVKPALIVLAVVNIMYKLWYIKTVKIPVFGTFFAVLLYHLLN